MGTILLTVSKSLCFLTWGRSAIDALLRNGVSLRKIAVQIGQPRPWINSYAKNIQGYGIAEHFVYSKKFSNPDQLIVWRVTSN
jgi:hypothetical protein